MALQKIILFAQHKKYYIIKDYFEADTLNIKYAQINLKTLF